MYTIQFVNLFSQRQETLGDKGFVPLGLVWLANYINARGYSAEILDTQRYSFEEVESRLTAKIVGINYTIMSTDLLDKAVLTAKQSGAYVVVGGQAATPCAKQLLRKNPNIDFVVSYDGEEALLQLLRLLTNGDGSLEDIPNLTYRKEGQIIQNPKSIIPVKTLPLARRSIPGIDMGWYIENFEAFGHPELSEPWHRVTNTFTQKGCPRRTESSGCSFCARMDTQFNARTPLQVYKEYKYLRDKYDVNYIFDDSDSWIRMSLMRQLYACYEEYGDLGLKIRVYGDVRDIHPSSVALMKKLNVVSVLMGIESGSERILRQNGKATNKDRILNAVRLLAENDITVSAAYVLGLIDESEKSLSETLDFARRIELIGNLQTNYWNLITPLPGSPIWNKMMQIHEFKDKYNQEYKFDLGVLRSDYANAFCRLGNNGVGMLNDFRNLALESLQAPVCEYLR